MACPKVGISIGDIFQLLNLQQKTGILKVKAMKDLFDITFEMGRVVDVNWINRPMERRLAALLEKGGKITKDQVQEAVLARQETIPQRLGYILANLGYVEPHDLEGPLKLHLMESLTHIFSIKDPDCKFEEKPVVEYDTSVFNRGKSCLINFYSVACAKGTYNWYVENAK